MKGVFNSIPDCPNCKITMRFYGMAYDYSTDEFPESKCYWKCDKCKTTWQDEFVPAQHKLKRVEK